MKHRLRVPLTALVLGLILFAGRDALGAPSAGCLALGGNPASPAGECQVNSTVTAGGVFAVPETLRICGSPTTCAFPGTGVIDLTSALTVNIGGDFVMDAGSLIDGNNPGSCSGGRTGLAITLNVTGDVTQVPGATIRSDSCSGGAILITSKASVDIDGLVESVGSISGVGATQPPGGGTIEIDASCNLTITDAGVVSSRGRDPGADKVHLQGGCKVVIDGLVESTGIGHVVPNSPKNHCDSAIRPDKPTNSTACVEVWAGDSLVLDSTGTHNGQVNADTGGTGGSQGTGWIDLFARGDINLIGDVSGTLFDVHANGNAGTNDVGGIITVKSRDGKVTTSGTIIQANALGSGGKGGVVLVQASGDVNFGTSQIQAKGAPAGGAPAGGAIAARSFNGKVLGTAPGLLDASGDTTLHPGSVTLQGCGSGSPGTDGVAYTGTSKPPFVNPGNACGGAPSFESYVKFPDCLCGGCFCLSSFFVSADGSTITILGEGLTGVKEVDFNGTCDPGGTKVKITSLSNSIITLALPGGTSGDHVILFNAAAGSSSCSAGTVP